ncbi:glycosyltransferase [Primorskyibacter sp. S187A]|uniref:glycosyltransferase n=1 Tax=Primorskyibacter sp. S187A TaxID=3415130 RepID=UPI003C7B09EF
MIYMMRHSFFGQSGWRSRASLDPDLLFDPERLDTRAAFMETMSLASLRDQADRDFDLVVLSSTLMPERYQTRLKELCGDMLGQRAHVIFRGPDKAGNWFQLYRRNTFRRHDTSCQIVLDDDDAVAVNFTGTLRMEAEASVGLLRPGLPDYVFLSHPRGVSAEFDQGHVRLTHRLVPATNLGLAMVTPTRSRRNPYYVAHKKILERRPVRVIYSHEPQYIRAVHASNDSRAIVGTDRVDVEDRAMMLEAFPLLRDLPVEWTPGQAAPAPLPNTEDVQDAAVRERRVA